MKRTHKLLFAIMSFSLAPFAFDGNIIRNRGHELSPYWSGVVCIIIGLYFTIGFMKEK